MLKVGPDTVVTIDYKVTWENGGKALKGSLQFTYGEGEVFKKLEEALTGLSIGEEKGVTLLPHEAYGEKDHELIMTVPRGNFPDKAVVAAGQAYETVDRSEEKSVFYVTHVDGEQVTIDFNHPLAGNTIQVDAAVKDIQKA